MVRNVLGTIRDRLASADQQYECGVCSTTFDREPRNCHTCGNPEIAVD